MKRHAAIFSFTLLLALAGTLTAADDDDLWPIMPATKPATKEKEGESKPESFKQFAKLIGRRFAPLDQSYVGLPPYDTRFPSSKGITFDQAQAELSRTVRENAAGVLIQEHTVKPDRAEVDAFLLPLPKMEVGQYGFIRAATVDKILGPDDMVVKNIQLIDVSRLDELKKAYQKNQERNGRDDNTGEVFAQRDKLVKLQGKREFRAALRLRGFPTHKLIEGQKWTAPAPAGGEVESPAVGVQIAVVGVIADPRVKKSVSKSTTATPREPPRIHQAIPLACFHDGLTKAQFRELLQKAGMTPDAFVELTQREMRKDSKDYARKVVEALEEKLAAGKDSAAK